MTSAQLAVQLEVSMRTIYRDLDILSKNGIPVSTTQGKGGGAFLADDFDEACVQGCPLFNDDEKGQLIDLIKAGDGAGQHKSVRPDKYDKTSAREVVDRLDKALGREGDGRQAGVRAQDKGGRQDEAPGQAGAGKRSETERGEQTKKPVKPDKVKKADKTNRIEDDEWIRIILPGSDLGERQSRIVEQIRADIEERHPASLLYRNSRGDRNRRMVEPVKLIFQDNTWYLYGYCRKRKDFRYFRLSRIEGYTSEKETFSPRAEGQMRPLRQKEKAEMTELSLRIEERLSDRVYEELGAGEITRDGDFLAVRIQMPEEERTYAYLLSYGSALEVAGPKRVRKDMKRRIKEMQKKY